MHRTEDSSRWSESPVQPRQSALNGEKGRSPGGIGAAAFLYGERGSQGCFLRHQAGGAERDIRCTKIDSLAAQTMYPLGGRTVTDCDQYTMEGTVSSMSSGLLRKAREYVT